MPVFDTNLKSITEIFDALDNEQITKEEVFICFKKRLARKGKSNAFKRRYKTAILKLSTYEDKVEENTNKKSNTDAEQFKGVAQTEEESIVKEEKSNKMKSIIEQLTVDSQAVIPTSLKLRQTFLGRLFFPRKYLLNFHRSLSKESNDSPGFLSFEINKINSGILNPIEFKTKKTFTGRTIVIKFLSNETEFFCLTSKSAEQLLYILFIGVNLEKLQQLEKKFKNIFNEERYCAYSSSVLLQTEFVSLFEKFKKLPKKQYGFSPFLTNGLYEFMLDPEEFTRKYNKLFIKKEAERYSDLFNTLEDNPLTEKQIESVVTEEDATLVVAGAGTGKTSSVVGKIGYLLKSNLAQSNNILALAFNRDAAQEMRERVKEKTGEKIEIRTFHSYGKNIIEEKKKEKFKIADFETHERAKLSHVDGIIQEMLEDSEESQLILNFISQHRYPAKYREDFSSQKDYLKYLNKIEPQTLKQEWVKSFEEVLIADWLTLHDIEYEYEKPYEHKTSSRKRQQYRPDFYLPKHRIYLEHFGIDKSGNTAPWINKVKYNESITWKRNLHKEFKTKLIETYSWERMEGTLTEKLKAKLEKENIEVKRLDAQSLRSKLNSTNVNKKLISLIKDFLSVFKEGLWTVGEISDRVDTLATTERNRNRAFFRIFSAFYKRYQQGLIDRQEMDFADLIVKATSQIKSGEFKPQFSHIIVDEFQDISRGRAEFLKSIRGDQVTKLMCVGDDWQAIYGFTGSDVRITTDFEQHFGKFERVDLDKTFRFRQSIINASARFVQKNPKQLRKEIVGRPENVEKDIIIVDSFQSGLNDPIASILKVITKDTKDKKTGKKVLILGRYNFNKPENLNELSNKFKRLNIEYMTIHKSKGLQADNIIILSLETAKYGFPGSIDNDPIMNLVRPEEDTFEHAEERRLFYVALTRTKEKAYLIKPLNPSPFLTEISSYPEVSNIGDHQMDLSCSECEDGTFILKYPNKKLGFAWECSHGRYCGGVAKFCRVCEKLPLIRNRCPNEVCKSNTSN